MVAARRVIAGVLAPLLVLALCLVPMARSDVFWRKTPNIEARLQELGGARLYATEVKINGYAGHLAVYNFTQSPATLGSRLARVLGATMERPQASVLLTHVQQQRLQRYMLLPSLARPDGCMVLALEQAQDDALRARGTPVSWPAGLPVLAAEPLFSAVCTKTRTTFVTATSAASPAAALDDAVRTLRAAGWHQPLPQGRTLQILTSGRRQCVVFAGRGTDGGTTITLLQREGATP